MSEPQNSIEKGLRLIQYGSSGAGKSIRASEAARWGLVEYHDFDDQSASILAFVREKFPEREKNLHFVSYRGLTDEQKIDKLLLRLAELGKDPGNVTTVVFDTYSDIEFCYKEKVMSSYKPVPGGFGKTRLDVKINDFTTIRDLGGSDMVVLKSGITKLINTLKRLTINVILNAHEGRGDSPDDRWTIAAYGDLKNKIPGAFQEVHRVFIDKSGIRRVQVSPNSDFDAKSAISNIPSNGILLDTSLSVFDGRVIGLDAPIKTC